MSHAFGHGESPGSATTTRIAADVLGALALNERLARRGSALNAARVPLIRVDGIACGLGRLVRYAERSAVVDAGSDAVLREGEAIAARFAVQMILGHEVGHVLNEATCERSHAFPPLTSVTRFTCSSPDRRRATDEDRADEVGLALACPLSGLAGSGAASLLGISSKVALEDLFRHLFPVDDLCRGNTVYDSMSVRMTRFAGALLSCVSRHGGSELFAKALVARAVELQDILARTQDAGWPASTSFAARPVASQATIAFRPTHGFVTLEHDDETSRISILGGNLESSPTLLALWVGPGRTELLAASATAAGELSLVVKTDPPGDEKLRYERIVVVCPSGVASCTARVQASVVPAPIMLREHVHGEVFALLSGLGKRRTIRLVTGIEQLAKPQASKLDWYEGAPRAFASVDGKQLAFDEVSAAGDGGIDRLRVSTISSATPAVSYLDLPALDPGSRSRWIFQRAASATGRDLVLCLTTRDMERDAVLVCPADTLLGSAPLSCALYEAPTTFAQFDNCQRAGGSIPGCDPKMLAITDVDEQVTWVLDRVSNRSAVVPALGVASCEGTMLMTYRRGRIDLVRPSYGAAPRRDVHTR